MSYDRCLTEARKLKKHLEAQGLQVSIELQRDAKGTWDFWSKRLNMSHHVASYRSQGLTPFLWLVKKGRPDVPGPLCNGYMGWDHVYRIITMGIANHSGAGGPVTFDGVTVPKDNGRYHIWGTEFEGGMRKEDWSDADHDAMARANAGITAYLNETRGATVECNLEHSTWAPSRKIDRLGYTRFSSIARIKTVLGRPGGGVGGGTSPVVAPKPVPNSNAHRKYKPGDVKRIQTILRDLGYCKGALDDDYGPWTEAAVLAYQKAQKFGGLYFDGDWGPATENHYQWTRLLQQKLNEWKGNDIRVDGDYGTVTGRRVYEVMERNHGGAYPSWAKLDGVPGPVFCKMLGIPAHPNL